MPRRRIDTPAVGVIMKWVLFMPCTGPLFAQTGEWLASTSFVCLCGELDVLWATVNRGRGRASGGGN